jgi:CelD/BcsL family acetyltransferase involved in cellulose biosynthesis
MIGLHEQSWQARGRPGAFASDYLRRFHRELISRTQPRGELELLRLEAQHGVVGFLYNFRLGGRVTTYQSGLAQAGPGSGAHAKPGLTCHALAIARALAAGDSVYDFLAGAHRYKLSLANASTSLFWAELVPEWSPTGFALRLARRCGLLAPALG